jgi:hypothetical protein
VLRDERAVAEQRVFILFVARRSLDQSHKRSIQKQLLFCRALKLQSEWEGRCRAELRLDFLVLLYWNQKFSSRTSFVFIIGNGCFFVSLNRVCCVLLPRATEIIICLETNHSSAPKYPPPQPRSSSLSLYSLIIIWLDSRWMDGRMNLFLITLEPTMFFMCTSDRRFYYVTWILYTDLWFLNWNSSSARNLWAARRSVNRPFNWRHAKFSAREACRQWAANNYLSSIAFQQELLALNA